MLTNTSNPIEQEDFADKAIKLWLRQRQELIVLYCKLDSVREYTPQETPIAVKVQALCQVLIDYVSAGHFEIYAQLLDGNKKLKEEQRNLIARNLPEIEKSTTLALEFNDRYATVEQCERFIKRLARDLNSLGMVMVERFELEDQLIDALHTPQRRRVA